MTRLPSPHALLRSLPDAGRSILRAIGLMPPDTAGMFLGLADDLFGAWPPEGGEERQATGSAATRTRAILPLAA